MAYNSGASSGNLVLIHKQTAASSPVNFTTGISGFAGYKLNLMNCKFSGASFLYMNFSNNGGFSWIGANYYYTSSGAFINGSSSVLAASNDSKFALFNNLSFAAGQGLFCNIYFPNFESGTYPSFVSQIWANGAVYNMGGENQNSTSSVNGIQITTDAGNITSGTLTLYGIQN